MDYVRLRAVIDGDAATFAALDDADAATEFMVANKSHDLRSITGKQVKDAFVGQSGEWLAIGAEGRSEVLSLIARDDLDPHGVDVLIFQQAIGINAPLALGVLQAARTITTSTAFINGLGVVKEIDVFRARELG